LDEEEQRLNLEAKQYHPVYNKMSFPDELGRPARTVTALCTRVSRESIIVQDVTSPNEVRRLSIRERACLQGFPITYQFFGKSHSEKAKLIGNAIPPLLTYYIANSMLGIESHELMPTTKIIPPNKEPLEPHPVTSPPVSGRKFPKTRSFRAALKGLRFGSGMRFELVNNMEDGLPRWKTAFYFGNSKDIKEVLLDSEVLDQINLLQLSSAFQAKCTEIFSTLTGRFAGMTHDDIQKAWTRHIDAPGPFIVADALGEAGMLLAESLEKADLLYAKDFTLKASGNGAAEPLVNGARKLAENSPQIFAGIIICSFFNSKGVALLDRVKSAA
jgi:DNA (cytosine-5)-methyltransferase 1